MREASAVKRHAIWLIPIALAVAVLAIVGLIVFSSDSSGVSDQRQLASLQRVCEQWSGTSAPMLGTSSASSACTTLTGWMNEQLQSGRMTGPMMWGTATAIGTTCRQWIGTDSRSSVSATVSPAWCDEMVGWMEHHIENWNDWMMNGSMMGGDAAGTGGGPYPEGAGHGQSALGKCTPFDNASEPAARIDVAR